MWKIGCTMQRLNMQEWLNKRYSKASAPSPLTVRRWIRDGRIYPPPVKQGRSYFFHPDAEYMDPAQPLPELIRRIANGTTQKRS
jgi:hypothetical protein